MSADARAVVARWMNEQGLRNPEEISTEDFANLRQLLSTERKGFGVFVSLMQFYRAQWAQELANADLSSSEGAVAASKLQGSIQCVDTMRELVLDIADPISDSSAEADVVAGVQFNG